MAQDEIRCCGCPPTAPPTPAIGGAHHVFVTVNDLERSTLARCRASYPEYVPGYYAIFFTHPDGIKLELVHIPG